MGIILLIVGLGTAALLALGGAPVAVTTRAGLLLLAAGLAALVVPSRLVLLPVLAVLAATGADLWMSRARPVVSRSFAVRLARGVPSPYAASAASATGSAATGTAGRGDALRGGAVGAGGVRLRQPQTPDLRVDPAEGDGSLGGTITALRRGRHQVPPLALRVSGPLGLGAWYRTPSSAAGPGEVLVYPDLPAARRVAGALRRGRFSDTGNQARGPLGLGTDFELVRDYVVNDDIRQVNWMATQRMARPMSNQYRAEQDRDVVILLDCGRLMAAPLPAPSAAVGWVTMTRLDAALDAVAALAFVADDLGDRCGIVAFDETLRAEVPPRRLGSSAVLEATFDLEPSGLDSDYGLACRRVGDAKRGFVLVLTDLLDEAAAAALLESLPVVTRRHAVCVASALDPGVEGWLREPPSSVAAVYRQAAAVEVATAAERVAGAIRATGAAVVRAAPQGLAGACAAAYIQAKVRARI